MPDDTPELRLNIDRLRLDEEWADQPKMFHDWAVEVADCQLVFDQAKARLEVVAAELYNGVRSDPSSYDITDKLTEKLIEATVLTQPEYTAATTKVNKARYSLEYAKASVNALEHKKRALSLLVELFIRDYYSDATVKPRSEAAADHMKEQTRTRARRRLEERADGDQSDE